MGKRVNMIVLCTLAAAVLVACGSRLSAEVNRAERQWREAGIDDYRIEVSYTQAMWHSQTHTITVRDGVVVEATAECTTAPLESASDRECEVRAFDPNEYTVPGLFALARRLIETRDEEWLTMEFDEGYGYPIRIVYSPRDVVDGDDARRVEGFEVLE